MVSKVEFAGNAFIMPIDHINYMVSARNGNILIDFKCGRNLVIGFEADEQVSEPLTKNLKRIFNELVEDLDLWKGLQTVNL